MTTEDSMPRSDDLQELAALYAAGALPADEMLAVEARLDAGDAELAAAVAPFLGVTEELTDAEPVTPDPTIKAALLARIGADDPSAAAAPPPFTVSRAADAQWVPLEIEGQAIEGAQIRVLQMDVPGNRVTALLRMEPGAEFPAHVHAQTEEFFVLEGDMRWDDEVYTAGDYFCAAPGSLHPRHHTKTGCLCLVTTSLANEYV